MVPLVFKDLPVSDGSWDVSSFSSSLVMFIAHSFSWRQNTKFFKNDYNINVFKKNAYDLQLVFMAVLFAFKW